MVEDTNSNSISPEDMLELERLWSRLDLEGQIAECGEVAVKRMKHLTPWKRALIIVFALCAAFELAFLMSQSWTAAFALGVLAGLAAGLMLRNR